MYKQLEAKKDCGGLLAIDDVFAIKLIVKNSKKQDEAQVCSDAQKVLKNHFPFEIEGEKDYISNPKSNGYKSLHNVITGSDGIKIHLQIRTKNMDYYSKRGIFAVWSLNKDESKRIKLQQRLIRELSFLREFENLIQEYGDDQSTEANKEFVNKCIVRVLSKKNP